MGRNVPTADTSVDIEKTATQLNVYTVKSDETLSQISERVNISVDAIMVANHLTDITVKPGQKLILPVER